MVPQTDMHAPSGLPGTDVLQHDLSKVRYLLNALRSLPPDEADNSDDLLWLRDRERYLRSAIASRDTLRRHKVVDLAQWRRCGETGRARRSA
jgi:hypothetical protein